MKYAIGDLIVTIASVAMIGLLATFAAEIFFEPVYAPVKCPFEDNAFNISVMPPLVYATDDARALPVTMILMNLLSHDYGGANEQLAIISPNGSPLPVTVINAGNTQISATYPAPVSSGTYAIHTHPLLTCGFPGGECSTTPSNVDIGRFKRDRVDTALIVTKTSNFTARVCMVSGITNITDSWAATTDLRESIDTSEMYRQNATVSFFHLVMIDDETLLIRQVSSAGFCSP